MKQDDVIRTSPPICALDFGVPAEFAERAESYARWAVAQEREKRTGTQEFVTLPREVVDRALEALFEADSVREDYQNVKVRRDSIASLRAALEQPQGEQEPVAMAKVVGMDEYGPMLLWNRAWTDFPVGTKLYTRPQNLHCKSNQARLAALWGYEKKQPPRQPLTDDQHERLMRGRSTLEYGRSVERAHNIK